MQRLHRIGICAALVLALTAPTFAADSLAQGNIGYRPPAEFLDVPAWAIAELNARGCRIPQASHFKNERHNVIRGEFVAKGQIDWAALCSKNGRSSITLLSTNKTACTQELAAADDSVYLQQVAQNQQAYSRMISAAPNSEIALAVKQNDGLDHEGIVDEFAEKASTVFYCRDGKWIELPTGD